MRLKIEKNTITISIERQKSDDATHGFGSAMVILFLTIDGWNHHKKTNELSKTFKNRG